MGQDPHQLRGLLRPAGPEELITYPVSALVNNPRNQGPGLTEPLPA